ncbi:threonine/serine ThrE exporter family protein [Heliorestis acidaminivorans]|uniref:threonine/serine ThrE exporter family protein n=1 Tax=Heliorestis acidaminivorans TaxID=553427 RepID=UPI001A9B68CC|nr:threonine/serine exporter family protein [Heliorestis acidaminivorans]
MDKSLTLLIRSGRILMESGAEIYRVEETIVRLGKALHLKEVQSYCTPTGLFIGYTHDEEPRTAVRRVFKRAINLRRISEVNDLARQFSQGKMSVESALLQLENIEKQKEPYPWYWQIFCISLVAAILALLNGGKGLEFAVALLVSGLLRFFMFKSKFFMNTPFLREFALGAFGMVLVLLTKTMLDVQMVPIMIGLLLSAFPGAYMVNSVRDIVAGDLLAGAIRGLEATGLTVALFGGAGMVLATLGNGYIEEVTTKASHGFAMEMLFGFMIAAFFSMALNTPHNTVLASGLAGLIGRSVLVLTILLGSTPIMGMFWGTLAVVILSEIMARYYKVPVTLFVIGGIIPLLPGLFFFQATYTLVQGDYVRLIEPFVQGAMGIISIGAAAAAITGLVRFWKTSR